MVQVLLFVGEGFQGGTRVDLPSVFLSREKIFTAFVFAHVVVLINYHISCASRIGFKNSHYNFPQQFCSCRIWVHLVCQTYDRLIFGRLSFPRTRWYVVTVRYPQMVLGKYCSKTLTPEVGLLKLFRAYKTWILFSSNLEWHIDVCSWERKMLESLNAFEKRLDFMSLNVWNATMAAFLRNTWTELVSQKWLGINNWQIWWR